MENKTRTILNFFGLALFVGFMTFLVTQSIGLGGRGFDNELVLQQQSFYLAGGIFLVLIICGFIIEFIIKKGDERYGSNILFANLGEKPSMPIFKNFSQFKMLYFSIIAFGILGLLMFVTQQASFTGVKPLEQQFTPTAELLYSSLLVTGSENLGLALVLLSTIIVIRAVARKKNWTSANFGILVYLIVPIMGAIYWLINHLLRYTGSDTTLLTVFGFGFVMSLITVLTGSFIPAWIMHISNNLFFDMQRLFTRDSVLMLVGLVILSLIVLSFFIFKKKNPQGAFQNV